MTEPSPDAAQPAGEIVRFQPRNTLAAKVTYAKELAQSGMLPKQYQRNPSNVLWAAELGEALNIPTITAINGVHVIEGKPTASAALIASLVRRAGHKLRIVGNEEKATVSIIRKDDPDFTFESVWTIDRAKKANLTGKAVWKQYPEAMLKARALTECARDACQEALNGCQYTPEELNVEVNQDGDPVTTVEVDWDAELEACAGDRAKLLNLHARAEGHPEIQERIVAAGKALAAKKVAESKADETAPDKSDVQEPAPEVVDAEIVEEAPKTRTQKVTENRTASQVFNELVATDSFDRAEEIAAQEDRTNITGVLTTELCELLDINKGDSLPLFAFATLVAEYIDRHSHSVQRGLDLAMGEAA